MPGQLIENNRPEPGKNPAKPSNPEHKIHYYAVMHKQVTRSIEIQSPPTAVWRWLATQEGLRHWISPNLEIDLRVGGSYRFLGPDDKTWVSGQVLEFEPEKSLILSWLEEDMGWLHPARLVIELTPTAAGTLATVIHDGFEGIGRADWPEVVEDYQRGSDAHQIPERLAALVNDALVKNAAKQP